MPDWNDFERVFVRLCKKHGMKKNIDPSDLLCWVALAIAVVKKDPALGKRRGRPASRGPIDRKLVELAVQIAVAKGESETEEIREMARVAERKKILEKKTRMTNENALLRAYTAMAKDLPAIRAAEKARQREALIKALLSPQSTTHKPH